MTPTDIVLQAVAIAMRLVPQIVEALSAGESEAESIARARAALPDAITSDELEAIKARALAKLNP